MRKLASLKAWTCARKLARVAYGLTLKPPLSRHFGVADQIRRSAVSIPANIAEGYALATTAQFIRCLRISLGSATELLTHLEMVRDFELAPAAAVQESLKLCDEDVKLLIGLLRSLESRSRHPLPSSRFPLPD